MFHSKPQPSWPRRPKHQPVGASREILVGECRAEHFIVGAKVFDLKAALGHAGRTPSFEGEDGLALESLRQPATDRPAAQPFVFERRELSEVFEGVDLLARIPTKLRSEIDPEGAPGLGVE